MCKVMIPLPFLNKFFSLGRTVLFICLLSLTWKDDNIPLPRPHFPEDAGIRSLNCIFLRKVHPPDPPQFGRAFPGVWRAHAILWSSFLVSWRVPEPHFSPHSISLPFSLGTAHSSRSFLRKGNGKWFENPVHLIIFILPHWIYMLAGFIKFQVGNNFPFEL